MTKKKDFTNNVDLDLNGTPNDAVIESIIKPGDAPTDGQAFPKMFDAHDISAITGIHYVTITKYFKTGKIRGQKFGRTWKATSEAIKEYMEGK